MLDIKKVKKEDIYDFKQKIWKEFNRETGYFFSEKEFYFELCVDSERIGYMEVKITDDVANLNELIIKSEFRGKKYGHKAMDYFEKLSIKEKCHKMRIKTSKDLNTAAYHLYIKHGFKEEAVLKNDYFNKDWVILSKFIDQDKKTKSES